jgi:hypothetical protein
MSLKIMAGDFWYLTIKTSEKENYDMPDDAMGNTSGYL